MGNIKILLLLLILAFSVTYSEFKIDRVDITIKDISSNGSARVRQSIQFFINTEYDSALYESGFSKNDLSSWANTTNLKEVKLYINPNKVDITDFRILPQPRKCNPFLEVCRGELIIDYFASPYYENQTQKYVNDTGIFKTKAEKPRTTKYIINPNALDFRKSDNGDILLDKNTYLNLVFPDSSNIVEINPLPENIKLPAKLKSLTWNNIALVQFSLNFEVEESIDKEVADFFSGLIRGMQEAVTGTHGIAILIIIAIFTSTYIYLQAVKRR